MTDMTRRVFMYRLLAASGSAAAAGALPYAASVQAASRQEKEKDWHFAEGWPREAYDDKKTDAAMKKYFGSSQASESDKITLKVPDIAENGAVVPITVNSKLPKVTRIAVFVPKNPYAMTVAYQIPEGTEPFVSNRIKMANGSNVIAVVESDGKLYKASKHVKVTVGGCGG